MGASWCITNQSSVSKKNAIMRMRLALNPNSCNQSQCWSSLSLNSKSQARAVSAGVVMRVHVIRNSACHMLKHRTADIGLRQRGEREQRRHSAAHVDRAEVYSNGHFLAKIWQPRIGSTWGKKKRQSLSAHISPSHLPALRDTGASITGNIIAQEARSHPSGARRARYGVGARLCWLFGRDCSILLCRPPPPRPRARGRTTSPQKRHP